MVQRRGTGLALPPLPPTPPHSSPHEQRNERFQNRVASAEPLFDGAFGVTTGGPYGAERTELAPVPSSTFRENAEDVPDEADWKLAGIAAASRNSREGRIAALACPGFAAAPCASRPHPVAKAA